MHFFEVLIRKVFKYRLIERISYLNSRYRTFSVIILAFHLQFLSTTPKCPLCAYVVPTYELDRRVANFPTNKSELVRLSRNKLAIPFHRKVFIYNQYASNFSK